jgi:ubiquinol-cytochrome c reductase cytochrome b subunit
VRSARFRPLFRIARLVQVVAFIILGYVGMEAADAVKFGIPLVYVGQFFTAYYFGFFVAILPFLSRKEKALPMPESIDKAVMAKSGCPAIGGCA